MILKSMNLKLHWMVEMMDLTLLKKLSTNQKEILKIKGMLALEIGNEQYKKVSKILVKNNFRVEHIIKDYKDNI